MTIKRNILTQKMKDLALEEIEYTENFFNEAFRDPGETIAILKEHAAPQTPQRIAPKVIGEEIDDRWLEQQETFDGQLAVDVFQTTDDIIITSTIAGVSAKDLDIAINGDMITIKGIRRHRFTDVAEEDYFIRECYWGGFSRSIILPIDIQHDRIEATLEHGVLTIRLPKSKHGRNGKISVNEVDSGT